VLENPGSSLLTWLVLGIALALPIGLNVVLDSVRGLSSTLDNPAQLSVFLHDETDPGAALALADIVAGLENVSSSEFVSRESALEEFRLLSGFADVLDSLEQNPLPALILVDPVAGIDEGAARHLQEQLQAYPEVAQVVLDLQWLQRLNRITELGQRMVLTVGTMLILGVVLILGNTIRLAIESRREEIVIVKLVGGSDAFVRRPFLYTGLWYGVGGGACAAVLVAVSLWFLQQPVRDLAVLYQSGFSLRTPGLMGALNVVITGGLLGLVGAWLAVSRHLGRIQPG
jgi:cell division transport system permease protein